METITVDSTPDGLGYTVQLEADGFIARAFVSSMHLVEDKLPQLRADIQQQAAAAFNPPTTDSDA